MICLTCSKSLKATFILSKFHDNYAVQMLRTIIVQNCDASKPNVLKGTTKCEMPALKLYSHSVPSQNVKDSLLFLYLNISTTSLVFMSYSHLVRNFPKYVKKTEGHSTAGISFCHIWSFISICVEFQEEFFKTELVRCCYYNRFFGLKLCVGVSKHQDDSLNVCFPQA